jgi:cyanophycinase
VLSVRTKEQALPPSGKEITMRGFVLAAGQVALLLAFSAALVDVLPPFASPPAARANGVPVVSGRAGSLVLMGGGKMTDAVRRRFLELAGGKEARLVVIPSASARPDAAARSLALWRTARVKSVRVLHATGRRQADDHRFSGPLRQATGVWISGGDQSRLAALYGGTGVERELTQVLKRGGVVGGTSAGASVVSRVMIAGTGRTGKGFGLVAGAVVDQHFSNRRRLPRLLDILHRHPDQVGIGIDEATAVVIRGGEVEVIGNGTVTVCQADSARPVVRVYRAGNHFHQPTHLVVASR